MILIDVGDKSGLSFFYPLGSVLKRRVRVIPWQAHKKRLPLLASTSTFLCMLSLCLFCDVLYSDLLFDMTAVALMVFGIIRIWVVRVSTSITITPTTLFQVAPILVWVDWIAFFFALALMNIHVAIDSNVLQSTPSEMGAMLFVFLALFPLANVVVLLLRNRISRNAD